MLTVMLRHDNGDELTCQVVFRGVTGGRRYLCIRFITALAGHYCLDLTRDALYAYGPKGGIGRTPINGWHAAHTGHANKVWCETDGVKAHHEPFKGKKVDDARCKRQSPTP